ncbi:MAG: hypothetical protein RJA98_2453 [Pseudomonadota bacterium]|jgi:hypothetical protein
MGPIDALWHLVNLFLPAAMLAALASALAKVIWRSELKSVAWWRLCKAAALAAGAATVAGLLLLGQDGKMVTYAAMVLASAAALAWAGFGPGRR